VPDTPASLEELGEQINRELGFSLEYKASTPTLFEFTWTCDLVRERVNECLNKLRLEHPRLAITSSEESCIEKSKQFLFDQIRQMW
jgi:hypothetical protein